MWSVHPSIYRKKSYRFNFTCTGRKKMSVFNKGNIGKFDIVCTLHRKQLCKQANKIHFLHVFILQSYNSTCFERLYRSSSGVHDLLYSAALYSKSWTPDDERYSRSKHVELYKNFRINTYRKCILLVCLYNTLTFRGHDLSRLQAVFLKNICYYIMIIGCD